MSHDVIHLRWDRKLGLWVLRWLGGPRKEHTDAIKGRLLKAARRTCRALGQDVPCQLRVFGKNGRIQFEHTYPRSSDPRPKPGSARNRG